MQHSTILTCRWKLQPDIKHLHLLLQATHHACALVCTTAYGTHDTLIAVLTISFGNIIIFGNKGPLNQPTPHLVRVTATGYHYTIISHCDRTPSKCRIMVNHITPSCCLHTSNSMTSLAARHPLSIAPCTVCGLE